MPRRSTSVGGTTTGSAVWTSFYDSERRRLDRSALVRAILTLYIALCLTALDRPASAQTSVATLLGRQTSPEGEPKRLLEEIVLWGYLENSYVINLGTASPHNVNDLRFYDHDADYSWNS